MTHNSYGVAYLECGRHRVTFTVHPPKAGELVWCSGCEANQRVAVMDMGFHVKCATCSFGRMMGSAEIHAEVLAAKHHRTKPHHLLRISKDLRYWRGTRLTAEDLKEFLGDALKVVTLEPSPDTLPLSDGAIPY